MATYIKASLKRSYAESFLTELERNENQYFFFIANPLPWSNENSPPAYTDTVGSEYSVMNRVIGYKKITPENVFFALPRYEWESGSVYTQYDDSVELFSDSLANPLYVITDEYKVYKCLENNGGGVSTQKPTEVFSQPFALSDGYVWKYLATVRESDLPYELSDYVPIDYAYNTEDTEVSNQYNTQITSVSGTIDRVVMSGVGASGVSAGVYPYSISGLSAVRLATITELSPTRKRVTITDSASRERIGSTPSNYVGYVLRIISSNVTTFSASEINNYGVIVNGTVSGNSIVFDVENDEMDFSFTPPVSGNAANVVLAEILPFVQILGNGSGGYAFPVMSSSKTISSVVVAGAGINYSYATASVNSAKTASSVHPTFRVVLSPKGGHGSNILKELSVKDVIIVVQVSDSDSEFIRGGGSYRQFGIIKNPVLSSNKSEIAGSQNTYYRDLFLTPVTTYLNSDFVQDGDVFVVGDDSKSSGKVVSQSAVQFIDGSSVKLKTVNSSGKFVTRLDRLNDYVLTYSPNGAPPANSLFRVGELVYQTVPSGTVFQSGAVYGYDLTIEGRIVESYADRCLVRVEGGGNFVANTDAFVVGAISGITASINTVAPRYGEFIRIFVNNDEQSYAVSRDGITRLYKVVSVGQPYYDTDSIPSFRGLHLLEVSTSVSGVTGAVDLTSSSLTQTSFSNGDTVTQGSTAPGFNYAAGTVYEWDFVNPSYGRLYLTGITGKFLSVAQHGLTGTGLGAFVVAQYHTPEIDPTSGEILYIDNVRPITRISGQKEEFRLRLGF
jgi:hypothetical protein